MLLVSKFIGGNVWRRVDWLMLLFLLLLRGIAHRIRTVVMNNVNFLGYGFVSGRGVGARFELGLLLEIVALH